MFGWSFFRILNNDEEYVPGSSTFIACVEYPAGTITYSNENIAAGTPGSPAPIVFDRNGADKTLYLTFNFPVDTVPDTPLKFHTLQQSDTAVFYFNGMARDQAPDAPNSGQDLGTGTPGPVVWTPTGKPTAFGFPPVIAACQTTKPAVMLFHDSREETGTEGRRANYINGLLSPAIARAGIGVAQIGRSSTSLTQFLDAPNKSQRLLWARWFTHIGDAWGFNDMATKTAAQTIANKQVFAAMWPGKTVFGSTQHSRSLTADGWNSFASQQSQLTASGLLNPGASAAELRLLNSAIRAGIPGYSFFFDVDMSANPAQDNITPISTDRSQSVRANPAVFTASVVNTGGGPYNILRVTAISAGAINVGDPLTSALNGSNTPVQLSGATIVSQGSGTPGGVGDYIISRAQSDNNGLTSRTFYVGGFALPDAIHATAPYAEMVTLGVQAAVTARFNV